MDLHSTLYATRGAVTAVAAEIGVSVPAVSQWRRRGIPEHRKPAVEAALRSHLASIGVSEINATDAATSSNAPAIAGRQ